ncbi:S-adenosyl-L-methionine-dependent methyltransferase [Glomus cerebriforme]|uniref:S-adenosyl-L-methionine-dependent methyltransferase n=1 Tax=Glomus cerebriforme TaxID=658196 RepID=A0A397T3G2_9GLOM|nr:S-adenosyl-L-methionine-dependent methyltransferase [Glomus cerebriforme]
MGNTSSHFKSNNKNIGCSRTSNDSFKFINGRRYLKNSDKYILPNDDEELDRLHVQHDLQLQIWKTHFSSPIEKILKLGGVEVLDVGCGSGNWLLEMATNYPLSNFTGIDIVPLYPMDTHPLNVIFESVDVSTGLPFPDNHFDFIYLKCLLSTIPEKHCNFKELKRVLKPGGWIEIMENDNEIINPGPTMKFFSSSYQALLRQRGINSYLCREIPKILGKHGFIEIHNEEKITYHREKSGTVSELGIENFISIFSTLKNSISEFTSINSQEFDNLLQNLSEEVNEFGSGFKMHRFFARKPLPNYIL